MRSSYCSWSGLVNLNQSLAKFELSASTRGRWCGGTYEEPILEEHMLKMIFNIFFQAIEPQNTNKLIPYIVISLNGCYKRCVSWAASPHSERQFWQGVSFIPGLKYIPQDPPALWICDPYARSFRFEFVNFCFFRGAAPLDPRLL